MVESELVDELRNSEFDPLSYGISHTVKVRKELRRPALQYTTANGEEVLAFCF
jgi:hypothetical protein